MIHVLIALAGHTAAFTIDDAVWDSASYLLQREITEVAILIMQSELVDFETHAVKDRFSLFQTNRLHDPSEVCSWINAVRIITGTRPKEAG